MKLWRVAWTVLTQLLTLHVASVDVTPVRSAHMTIKASESTNKNDVINRPRPNRPGQGMRPLPSDDLPILPLEYPEGDRYSLPTKSDLDPHKLRKLMGESFNRAYMSSRRPAESVIFPNGSYEYTAKESKPAGRMPDEFRKLSFRLPGLNKKYRVETQSARRQIRSYLWRYTYCPVHYRWRDLGPRFWPRWIREGSCGSGRSCSIPAGMTCRAQDSTSLTVLWWHCRRRTQCHWLAIKYPIIVKCGCSC